MVTKEVIRNQREDLAAAYRLAAQFSFNEAYYKTQLRGDELYRYLFAEV